ncbi:MFS transporter [Winogradskya consettensis]|uniref:MFS transporter n=1 Tax=Winogradskya consettensis TaxID=113560 RepID=A0A919VM12_9ACTN|nr:MFS transporter [Actinoplanes consettensis]GIM68326.1 MFS transporter [Actinoplanes consettensis]
MRAPAVLALGTFALGTDAYLTAGLLIPIAGDFGSSPAATGQLVTAFTLAYALAAPPLAMLLPGRRRTVLAYAMAIFVAANVTGALAQSLPVLFVSRAVAGAAAGVFSPLAATTAAALVAPHRRGRALSLVLAGLSAGSVAGVPAGLILSRHHSWAAALWLVAGCGALAFTALLLVLPAGEEPRTTTSLRDRTAALRDRRVAAVVTVTLLQTTASLGAYTYLAPVLAAGGVTDPTVHLGVWGAGGLLGSLAAGPVLDRGHRPPRLAAALLAVLAVALVGFTLSAGTAAVFLACAAWGAAGWAFVVPQQHQLLRHCPDTATAAIGANSSATYLGSSIGAALGGTALAAGVPAVRLPVLAAVIAVLGLAVAIATSPSASRSEPRRSRA